MWVVFWCLSLLSLKGCDSCCVFVNSDVELTDLLLVLVDLLSHGGDALVELIDDGLALVVADLPLVRLSALIFKLGNSFPE